MSNISIRLSAELEQRLAEEAQQVQRPRSDIVRDAIRRYLDEAERQRFLGALLDDARRLSEEETAGTAEESLPFDNESLAIGEPPTGYGKRGKKKKKP